VLDLAWRIETLPDINELTELLRFGAAATG